MPGPFTVNKGIEQPPSGAYVNAWAAPVNANWEDIDNSFGGATSISVTSVAGGTYALSLSQYQPPNIEFSGTLGASLNYQLPTGVGGVWTISNATSGAFSLVFSIAAGNSLALPAGRSLIVSDGVNVAFADSAAIASGRLVGSYTGITAIGNATALDDGGSPQLIGWRGTPPTVVSSAYTLQLSDRGKGIQIIAGPGIILPAGVFSNGDAFAVTALSGTNSFAITQGSGLVLYWAGNGTTSGNRTLTSVGLAAVQYQSSTVAIIGGAGLT